MDEEMIKIHTDLGRMDERIKSFEQRVNGMEVRMDNRLERIETKINENNLQSEQKLKCIDEKVDSILELQSQLKGGWKTITVVTSGILILCGFVAWMTDKWELVKNTFLG